MPRGRWGLYAAALVVAAVIAVGWRTYGGSSVPPGAQPSAAAQVNESLPTRARGPTPAVPLAAPAAPTASSADRPQHIAGASLAQALATIDAPRRPIVSVIQDYRSAASPSEDLRLELLAGLSYCNNAAAASDLARGLRSAGDTKSDAVRALDAQATEFQRSCQNLNPADLELRSELVLARARTGDRDAMLAFYDVGPHGSWRTASDPDYLLSWHKVAIEVLADAVRLGSASALDALVSVFSQPPRSPQDAAEMVSPDPLVALRDDRLAYAYALVYSEHLRSTNQRAYLSYRDGTLRQLSQRLSPARRG